MKSGKVGAVVMIAIGVLFLLGNLGWIPQLGPFLRQWWPVILIALGVWMLAK
jgi:hypothetical protein